MSLKEVLTDYGITVHQAITVIPVVIGLVGLLLKFLKKPFELIDMISRNKFILLSVKEKSDAIATIYEEIDADKKSDVYARELKLAHYGLKYPVYTLRLAFDYLYMIKKLTTPLFVNDFLKYSDIFTINNNSLPVVALKGLASSLVKILFMLALSIFGFAAGLEGITEALHSKPDWESGSKLIFFSLGELLFLSVIFIFLTEIYSIIKATRFANKMRKFHDEQLYKKFKK